MPGQNRLVVESDLESLSERAAGYLVGVSEEAIRAHGRFAVALSGGSTPRRLYELLAGLPFASQLDWPRVHIFWVDERWVPPDHPDSNYRLVRESLLAHVPIPAANIHPMPAQQGVPEQAAAAYADTLARFFALEPGVFPCFDLILLGMGEDGHTASLFPGTTAIQETQALTAAVWVEKLQTHRLTLTPLVLNSAAHVAFLIAGAGKAETVQRVLEGEVRPDVLPSQIIRPVEGELVWFLDRAAAGHLRAS